MTQLRNWLVHIAAVVPVLSLAGCSSMGLSGQGLEAYKSEAKNYYECGLVNGRKMGLALPREDPLYLAVAVQGNCGREHIALADAIMAHERGTVWQQRLDMHERGFTEAVIAQIIEVRSGAR